MLAWAAAAQRPAGGGGRGRRCSGWFWFGGLARKRCWRSERSESGARGLGRMRVARRRGEIRQRLLGRSAVGPSSERPGPERERRRWARGREGLDNEWVGGRGWELVRSRSDDVRATCTLVGRLERWKGGEGRHARRVARVRRSGRGRAPRLASSLAMLRAVSGGSNGRGAVPVRAWLLQLLFGRPDGPTSWDGRGRWLLL